MRSRRTEEERERDRAMRSLRLLMLLLVLLLFACVGKTEAPEAQQTASVSTKPEPTEPEPTEPEPTEPAQSETTPAEQTPIEKKATLMIYMIGSDLESRLGAGNADLAEIRDSGVDLSEANIAVFAGGSRIWHDEKLDEPQNRIRMLEEDGFCTVEQYPAASMGEADTLAFFINYAVGHFPAEHYALILWDHGSGPVKGYGLDELFQKDSLTLKEMREAMEQTPFCDALRLDWVGFDACMMASAELACTWSPYADYLVASQETEPSVGWEYGFLSEWNKVDTETFLRHLAARYLDASRAYFAETKTGADRRNATLSVMDLSLAPELETAIDALFQAAGPDVAIRYDALAYSRVNTRSLCRTSTGSEYDLVDLGDLAVQMEETYPDETSRLLDVIGRMVICSETNNVGLSGLSLYYPFYNKSYYLKSWAEEYAALGLFPAYQAYLSKYAEIWTDGNMKTDFAFSGVPKQIREDYFTLDLTEEQAAHFASARYYIMQKVGDDYYLKGFTGADVKKRGTILNARYAGKGIVAVDETIGASANPVAEEIEQINGITYYAISAVLSDELKPKNERKEPVSVRIVVSVNEETEELSIVSVQRADEANTRAGEIAPGRQEDIDPMDYTTISYPLEQARFVTRENGVVDAYENWIRDTGMQWFQHSYRISENLNLWYDYPPYGEFAIVFEIRDTQNNVYCSEPLKFDQEKSRVRNEAEESAFDSYKESFIVKYWQEDADRLELLSTDGLTLSLELDSALYLTLENRSEHNVQLDTLFPLQYRCGEDTVIGGDPVVMYCPKQHRVKQKLPVGFGMNLRDGTVTVENIMMNCCVCIADNGPVDAERAWARLKRVIDFQGFMVMFQNPCQVETQGTEFIPIATNNPFHGAKAEPHTVYEDDHFRIDLTDLTVYSVDDQDLTLLYLWVEKRTDADLRLGIPYLVINHEIAWNVYGLSAGEAVTPQFDKNQKYGLILIAELTGMPDMDYIRIDSIDTLELAVELYEGAQAYPKEVRRYPIQLSQHGKAASEQVPGELLYEENGVRMRYLGWSATEKAALLLIENGSDQGISLELNDVRIHGAEISKENYPRLHYAGVDAGLSRICLLKLEDEYWEGVDLKDVTFRPVVMDITHSRVLFRSGKAIAFSPGS